MPSFTIFKHHVGRDTPSFEMIDLASPSEARAYALNLLSSNDNYDRMEIVQPATGYEEVVRRP